MCSSRTSVEGERPAVNRGDAAKRTFDLVFSIPGLLALLPVMAVLALWVRLDSPGPAFYRQARVGRLGKVFRIWKLRTMNVAQPGDAAQVTGSGDPRITRSGRILRRYKLDELPQLIN